MLVSFMKQFRTLNGLCLKHNIVVLNKMDFIDLNISRKSFSISFKNILETGKRTTLETLRALNDIARSSHKN